MVGCITAGAEQQRAEKYHPPDLIRRCRLHTAINRNDTHAIEQTLAKPIHHAARTISPVGGTII